MKLSEHEIFKYVTQHILDPQLWAIALDLQILIDQLEAENAALKRENEALEENGIDLCVMLKEWAALIHGERLGELHRETSKLLERNMTRKEAP